MTKPFLITLALISLIIITPLSASAWFFSKQKTPTPIEQTPSLSEQEQKIAAAKLKKWQAVFDNCEVDELITSGSSFTFSAAEITHLFNNESQKAKKPILSQLTINLATGKAQLEATFHRFLKGRISFSAAPITTNHKLTLSVSQAKIKGFPLPSALIQHTLNRELNKYFDCLYRDDRYQDISITLSDNQAVMNIELK